MPVPVVLSVSYIKPNVCMCFFVPYARPQFWVDLDQIILSGWSSEKLRRFGVYYNWCEYCSSYGI